ncbi:MAG: ABC transporter permease, partial [Myxococcota bacterium]
MSVHILAAAWRVLKNDLVFSVLTITSLAVGCTCALLVGVYVVEELSYERFLDGAEQIARVEVTKTRPGEKPFASARAPSGLPPLLVESASSLESHTRVAKQWFTVQIEDTQFNNQVSFVDPSYFDVFALDVLHGDATASLADPSSVILSYENAIKYFGQSNAVGKTVRLNPFSEVRVGAVLAALPATTHLEPELIAPMNSIARRRFRADADTTLAELNVSFYVRAKAGAAESCFASVKALAEDILQEHANGSGDEERRPVITVDVTPIVELHLLPAKIFDLTPHGDPQQLALFAAVALLVLLVAGFNYVTMSLARAFSLAQEVGIRKALGALPRHIAVHYLGISAIFTTAALVLGFGFAELLMPWFSAGVGRELGQASLHDAAFLSFALLSGALLALLVGAYPALFLARQPPVSALDGRTLGGRGVGVVSRGLLLAQLTAATVLLILVATMASQARFIAERPLGFEHANRLALMGVNYGPLETVKRFRTFARGLSRHPAIRSVGAANAMPSWNYERQARVSTGEGTEAQAVYLDVDLDFFRTLGTTTLAGRTFDAEHGEDRTLEDKPFGRPEFVPAVLSREAARQLKPADWRAV